MAWINGSSLRGRGVGAGAMGVIVVALGAPVSTPAAVSTAHTVRFVGAEVPPISSTLGTFAGVAGGGLKLAWRAQIEHEPLSGGKTVAVTGGTFSMRTSPWRKVTGAVTGGSVTPLSTGKSCRDQIYRVVAELTVGRMEGTLTHYRRRVLGTCVIYSAAIRGSAALDT